VTEEVFGFAVLPLIMWGALRFGIVGTASLHCVIAGAAVWATAHHVGPFVRHGTALQNAGVLQAFIAALSLSGLTLAAERQTAEQALKREEVLRSSEQIRDRSREVRSRAVARYHHGTVLAIGILLVSLIASLSASRLNRKQAFERNRTRFLQEAERTRLSIISRLELYEDGLYATRSFFQVKRVNRATFHDYVSGLNLGQRYPGIQGIGYGVRLLPGEVNKHGGTTPRRSLPVLTSAVQRQQ
jgi:hypothetical protein